MPNEKAGSFESAAPWTNNMNLRGALSTSILASIGPMLMQVTCTVLLVSVETRQPRAVKIYYPGWRVEESHVFP